MIYMTLCPKCRTIQKAGSECSICKCPVSPPQTPQAQAEETPDCVSSQAIRPHFGRNRPGHLSY